MISGDYVKKQTLIIKLILFYLYFQLLKNMTWHDKAESAIDCAIEW